METLLGQCGVKAENCVPYKVFADLHMWCVCVQVLAYSVACVTVSAFSAGLIDAAKAEEVMDTLRSLTEESQQVSR